jgi:hypothetical protein
MVAYEARLNADSRWALSEGSRHFEKRSAVQETLRRIAQRLDALEIPYAIAGGMALFQHGYRRFTEDVDVLVKREGLAKVHESLAGLGYVPTHAGSKNVRDAQTGVRIAFLVAGEFPGDGAPKPVVFPDPGATLPEPVSIEHDGVRYLGLAALIELKLASGMTSPARMRDLSDVLEVIRILKLPISYADRLSPYVRPKFIELHRAAMSEGVGE